MKYLTKRDLEERGWLGLTLTHVGSSLETRMRDRSEEGDEKRPEKKPKKKKPTPKK